MRGVAEEGAYRKLMESLENRETYFGMSQSSISQFKNLVRDCRPNPDSSKFPDFLSRDAFIEHFYVTSSKENKNGSTQLRDESVFYQRNQGELKRLADSAESGEPVVVSDVMVYDKHSYDYLKSSFDRNWTAHLRKGESFLNSDKVGVFLVEYPDFGLRMCEDKYRELEDLSIGDWPPAERWDDYRLSRDKGLLSFVLKNSKGLSFVAFMSGYVEVFEIATLSRYISFLKSEYAVSGGPTLLSFRACSFEVPEGSVQ